MELGYDAVLMNTVSPALRNVLMAEAMSTAVLADGMIHGGKMPESFATPASPLEGVVR